MKTQTVLVAGGAGDVSKGSKKKSRKGTVPKSVESTNLLPLDIAPEKESKLDTKDITTFETVDGVKIENKVGSAHEVDLGNTASIEDHNTALAELEDHFDEAARLSAEETGEVDDRTEEGCKQLEDLYQYEGGEEENSTKSKARDIFWLVLCFVGIMFSFVLYGLLLEYATSGGKKLHELSFLFVTSALYTTTAAAGRYVRDETPTSIPPARFAVLGFTSMGSTFCSVRSLRYVIYPIQVLAKSCKPVPVMIIGAMMGKKYPLRKYINVFLIVTGVAMFTGGGSNGKKSNQEIDSASPSQIFGVILLFISLCFDGGTGAYEDKLMSVHSVGPFDLMYNIQLGKTILAGIGLLVLNQVHLFMQMCQDMGFLLVALGFSGALGQVFIFVTIAKFGALTCSIIGLARKVVTLVASIYFYGHHLNPLQFVGLMICILSMVMEFVFKSQKGTQPGHGSRDVKPKQKQELREEDKRPMLDNMDDKEGEGDVELAPTKPLT